MTNWLVRTFIRDPDGGSPAVRQRYGLLSGLVGILLNLLLSGGKFLAGVLTGSIAVTADAFNNLSDAGASVVTLVGFQIAGKQADDDHPFGHGRAEYLSGLLVALAIILVGVELGKSSVGKILHPEPVFFSLLSVYILLTSILVKLWMFFFNRALSRRIGSAAMAATATDSLSDVVTTSAVLLGTLTGHFLGLEIDGWVGILVAVFILKAGFGAAKDTLDPLLGQSPDPALVDSLQEAILAHPEISGIHDMVVHDYGPGRVMLSLHAEVPQDADIMVIHDLIDNVEKEIKETFRIEAVIHMDPIATDDTRTLSLREAVSQLVRGLDAQASVHDFRVTPGPDHTNLIFDAVLPRSCPLTDEAAKAEIVRQVAALGENFFAVVNIDRVYVGKHS